MWSREMYAETETVIVLAGRDDSKDLDNFGALQCLAAARAGHDQFAVVVTRAVCFDASTV